MTTTQPNVIKSNDGFQKGLYGSFYEDANFRTFIFSTHGEQDGGMFHFMSLQNHQEEFNSKTFQSARWTGQIKIPETGSYLFTSPLSYRFCMKIWETVTFEIPQNVLDVMKRDEGIYRISQQEAKSKLSCKVENGVYKISLLDNKQPTDAMNYGDVEIRIPPGSSSNRHEGSIVQQTQQEDMSCDLKKGVYKIQIEYIPLAPIQQNENIFMLNWQTPTIIKQAGDEAGSPKYNQVIPAENFMSPDFSDKEYFPKYITENMFDATKLSTLSEDEKHSLVFDAQQRQNFSKEKRDEIISQAEKMKSAGADTGAISYSQISAEDSISPDFSGQTANITSQETNLSATTKSQDSDKKLLQTIVNKLEAIKSIEKELKEIGVNHTSSETKVKRWALAREQMYAFNMGKTPEEKERYKKAWRNEFIDAVDSSGKPDLNKRLDPDYDPENPNARYVDADRDGIKNFLATQGFTVTHGGQVTAWIDDYDTDTRYTKYTCRYDQASTAGDPFTDLEKINGLSNALTVTKNPFIAACPQVSVQMTGYSLFENVDITTTSGKSFSFSTSNSVSDTNSNSTSTVNESGQNVSMNAGISAEGPSIGGGGGLSWSESLSHEASIANTIESRSDNTQEQSSSVQKHFNTINAANLNSYVKYQNTGTAAISKLTPTFNFNLFDQQNGKMEPIVTVRPPNQTGAESVLLAANASYPSDDQETSLVIRSSDTFNSGQIQLTKDQLNSVLSGNKMSLSLLQYEGYIADKGDKGNWISLQDKIQKNTAHLTLVTPDGKMYDRRIAAPRASSGDLGYKGINPAKGNTLLDLYAEYDKIPRLSIGEAIKMGFGDQSNNFWKTNENGIKYNLQRNNVNLIVSRQTQEDWQEQKKYIANEIIDTKAQLQTLETQKSDPDYQKKKDKGEAYLTSLQRKQGLLTGKKGTDYDYELRQGMRIVIQVPPIVTAEFKNHSTSELQALGLDQYPQSIVLTNHHLTKKMYYTIQLAPSSYPKGTTPPDLHEKGVLEPSPDPKHPQKKDTKIPHLTNQDVVQVWIGTTETDQKLLIHKNVGQIPGFRAEKARIDNVESFKRNFEFMSWIIDPSHPSSYQGIELFISSKEALNDILSFALEVEDPKDGTNNQKYAPIKVEEVLAFAHLEEVNTTQKNGFKVKIHFSLFKGFDATKTQLGQTVKLRGKLNEAPIHPDWGKIKQCDVKLQDSKACSVLSAKFEDPRECELCKETFPGERFSIKDYVNTFKGKVTLTGSQTMESKNNPEQPRIENVHPKLTLSASNIDPLLLTGIQELTYTLTGTGKDEIVTMGRKFEYKAGELNVQFNTKTKLTYKQKTSKGKLAGDIILTLICTFCGASKVAEDLKDKSITYDAEVDGLIGTKSGEITKVLTVNLVVNKDILKPEDKGINTIEIFSQKI